MYSNSSLVAWVLLSEEGQPNRPNWIIELPKSSLTFCIDHSWPFLWFEIMNNKCTPIKNFNFIRSTLSGVLLGEKGQINRPNWIIELPASNLNFSDQHHHILKNTLAHTDVNRIRLAGKCFFLKQQRGDFIMIIFWINNGKIFQIVIFWINKRKLYQIFIFWINRRKIYQTILFRINKGEIYQISVFLVLVSPRSIWIHQQVVTRTFLPIN